MHQPVYEESHAESPLHLRYEELLVKIRAERLQVDYGSYQDRESIVKVRESVHKDEDSRVGNRSKWICECPSGNCVCTSCSLGYGSRRLGVAQINATSSRIATNTEIQLVVSRRTNERIILDEITFRPKLSHNLENINIISKILLFVCCSSTLALG